MLLQAGPTASGNPAMRPAFLITVLMILFLTLHTDWSSRQAGQVELHTGAAIASSPLADARKSIHEQIIYELSVGNERLERENAALRQHVLDIRRAARSAGLKLNSTMTFLPIPGLEDILTVPHTTRSHAEKPSLDAGKNDTKSAGHAAKKVGSHTNGT